MSYLVKRCARCKTANESSMKYCGKCGADLPVATEQSDTPPMPPPAYAVAPAPAAVQTETRPADAGPRAVRVVDVNIPFWSLVNLLVKVAVASIPALVVLTVYAILAYALLATLGAALR